jgi:predicted ATPase
MERIKLSNFRKIKDNWDLDLAPITFFTGTNNSGKSTIFKALLLLEDFVKSSNHFKLEFKGPNSKKHKIQSYKNAVSGFMLNSQNWDLKFTYYNLGHIVSFHFEPQGFDNGIVNKGKLKFLEITRDQDKSKLIIENTGSNNYLLMLDNSFLEDISSLEVENNLKSAKNIIPKIEKEIQENERNLKELISRKNDIENTSQGSLKDPFESWLFERTKSGSGKVSSYIKALELISDKIRYDIFENYVIDKVIELYRDVLVEQKIEGGKYYDEKRPSYGMSGFYSAALKKYIEFLEDNRDIHLATKKDRSNGMENIKIVKSEDYKNLSRIIIEITQEIKILKGKLTSLKRQEKSTSVNVEEKIVFRPEFSLTEFDSRFLSIDAIITNVLPKYLAEEQKRFGKIDESIELKKSYKFGEKVRDLLSFSIDHLSPHRNNQTRLYVNADISSDINEVIRENANNPFSKNSKAGAFLKTWMSKFDIGQDYNINQIEGVATQIKITDNGLEFDLADKGFGAGQVFTILLKIALVINLKENEIRTIQNKHRRKGYEEFLNTILIEEPEANLHPGLQSKLAELFLDANKEFGINFIIETHSEYIIRKSQLLNLENPNFFKLYYFDVDKPYEMEYLNNGKFNRDFGEGFTDVADNIEVEIYKKNIKRK